MKEKFSSSKIAYIRGLYRGGSTINTISRQLSISKSSVHKYVCDLVKTKAKKVEIPVAKIKEMHKNGADARQISKVLDVPIAVVDQHRLGVRRNKAARVDARSTLSRAVKVEDDNRSVLEPVTKDLLNLKTGTYLLTVGREGVKLSTFNDSARQQEFKRMENDLAIARGENKDLVAKLAIANQKLTKVTTVLRS